MNFFVYLGQYALRFVNTLGSMLIFSLLAFSKIFRPKQLTSIIQQVAIIGARSSAIVLLVGLFTGMVLGLQLYHTLVQFGSAGVLGAAVGLTLVRELGPVLAAIMVTARAGSAMTTEIGIQRITEQIDALYTMGVDPVRYLVSPRLAAAIISFPLLTSFFDLIGILGGYLTGVLLMGLDSGTYFSRVRSSIDMADINNGLIKSLVFAVIVATVSCYHGYFVHMREDSYGAKAVGYATTNAVVLSCVLILVSDYFVTSFLM